MVTEQFASGGARLGTPWGSIDPAHQARKPNPQPLVETGALLRSFQGTGRNAIRRRSKSRGAFGSKHPLAHLHHHGSRGGQLPARPILFPTKDINVRIREIVRDHLND